MLRALAPLALLTLAPLVCRYTVRDVGFVDLGDEPFRLWAFVSAVDTPDVHADLRALARAILADSNVELTILDPDDDADHPAARYLRTYHVQEFPFAVLEAPTGAATPIALGGADPTELDALALDAVVTSPTRARLLELLPDHFCVVLLIEGTATVVNETAHTAIDSAFDALERVFDRMPKAVGALTEVVVVPGPDRAGEAALLLGLDIDATLDDEPSVAVLFGRGRRVGPVLDGDGITPESLFAILANAGRSCECGLDRHWMRGPRVPLRWDAEQRARTAAALAFDPDSPLVQAEVAGILNAPRPQPAGDPLFGYAELVVEADGQAREPTLDELVATFAVDVGRDATAPPEPVTPPGLPPLSLTALTALAIVLASAAAAVFVLRTRSPSP